jgi:hypothetical protein
LEAQAGRRGWHRLLTPVLLPFCWRGMEAWPSGLLLATGGLGCRGAAALSLEGAGSLLGRSLSLSKPTGYYTAFVCLVTQLLVIEKFHCSVQGRPADPSSRDAPIFQKIRD